MHGEILREKIFSEFYAATFSDCPSNMCTSVSDDDHSSEYSSESDDVKLSDWYGTEHENETYSTGEWALASAEEWTEDNTLQKSDVPGVSGVNIECIDLQSDGEMTMNFCPARGKIDDHRC